MREFLIVLAYTFSENIRKKTFIVSIIITLILTVAMMIIPGLITNSPGSGTPDDNDQKNHSTVIQNFYVVDTIDMLKNDTGFLSKTFTDYNFKMKTSSDVISLIDRIKADENTFLLVLGEREGKPTFEYYFMSYEAGPDFNILEQKLKDKYASNILDSAGVDASIAAKVTSIPDVSLNELGKGQLKSRISSMLIMFILIIAIYYFGYGVAMSVASEKTSRVMETLITSTRPSRIIMGKTVAMGLLGLSQMVLIFLVAVITYKLFFPKNFRIFGQSIDFAAFSPLVIVMIMLYFVLGYFLYAMLYAVAGASVSKSEDINTSIMPISMLSILAFYIAYVPAIMPNSGNITTVTSIIPFTSPFSMPGRLLMSNVSSLELTASITLLIATIVLFSWVSIKIYSAAILNYGNRLKLSDFIEMTKSKH